MRVVFVDAKKIGVITVVIIFMVVLFLMGDYFNTNKTFVVQSEISEKYDIYEAMKGNVKYKLPSNWETKLKDFGGNEILYHNDFKLVDSSLNGFVQVWNLPNNLVEFLSNSKVISEKQNEIVDYNIITTRIKGKEAYIVNYKIKIINDIYYKAYEYFISYKEGFIRFSFYIGEENIDTDIIKEFDYIVNSLNMK